MFFKGSRYNNVEDTEFTGPDGRVIRYKKVRFIPEVKSRHTHTVQQGERLDHIAHRYYRDPERFWRICDANGAMQPEELTTRPGRRINIPPAEG